jgi:hypothetical protein
VVVKNQNFHGAKKRNLKELLSFEEYLRSMKNILLAVLFFVSLFVHAQKSTPLFNGKDLSGWDIYGTEKWYAQNGNLICESGPHKEYGYLATTKEFKDFELTLEFKQESNGNSGVFFHSSIEGTKITGWQAEVAPMNLHTGGIYESYGRGWLIKPDSSKEKYLKENNWNKMKVRVKGNEVTTWLNGKLMIQLKDEKINGSQGKIALQIHSGGGVKVRWRKIRVTEL